MDLWADESILRAVHARMRAAAARLRLPFRGRTWRGETGNWQGAGVGSSIDFQDHRPYLPGDDPRYIDWQAYARTGHYSMKLYREEVSPRVDVALDVSASMHFDPAKRDRTLELFYFCVESARQSASSLRCHAVGASASVPWQVPEKPLRAEDHDRLAASPGPPAAPGGPALGRVPWRQGSLRVLISDLLFPGSPENALTALVSSKGRAVIFAPFCRDEAQPGWHGNVELIDCESTLTRVQYVDADLLTRYVRSYERHFDLWQESGRRHAVPVARVSGDGDFFQAMRADALRLSAVELTN